MDVHKSIDEIIATCVEAHERGEPLPVDVRFLDALVRYEARRLGLLHPLSRFGLNGYIPHCHEADVIIDAINAITWQRPGSAEYKSAEWFLMKDEKLFWAICQKIGMDGKKFRRNLRRVQKVGEKKAAFREPRG